MLRFFRQIRQRLITDNKFSKYLLYAVGEIILVMIGILLALQVNNWNQEQEQQKAIKRYLVSLVKDLEMDLEQFQARSDQAIFRFYSSQQLLKMVGQPQVNLGSNEAVRPLTTQNIIWNQPLPREPDSLFLALSFLYSIRGSEPRISRPTFEEMTSTGYFSLINNTSLKDAINEYYNEIDWRFGEEMVAERRKIIQNWKESLSKSGVLAQDVSSIEDPLDLIRNNMERSGHLRNVIRSAWFESEGLDRLHASAFNLIQQIEKELDK